MSSPTEAKHVRATHRFYPSRVRFVGTIPHGKSTREIAIDIDPELILRIADAIRATDGGRACKGPKPKPLSDYTAPRAKRVIHPHTGESRFVWYRRHKRPRPRVELVPFGAAQR